MKAKILIFSFLLIFCILEVKAEVLKSESQFKMDCSLHIKNFSGQAVDIWINNLIIGQVEAKSEKIFFNCLDCRGGELGITAADRSLISIYLTVKNSWRHWSEKPQKDNFWTIQVCPDLTVALLPAGKCQWKEVRLWIPSRRFTVRTFCSQSPWLFSFFRPELLSRQLIRHQRLLSLSPSTLAPKF